MQGAHKNDIAIGVWTGIEKVGKLFAADDFGERFPLFGIRDRGGGFNFSEHVLVIPAKACHIDFDGRQLRSCTSFRS